MLSIEKCKALIDGDDMTDDELVVLRDSLYEFIQLTFEVNQNQKVCGSKNPLGLLPPDESSDKV